VKPTDRGVVLGLSQSAWKVHHPGATIISSYLTSHTQQSECKVAIFKTNGQFRVVVIGLKKLQNAELKKWDMDAFLGTIGNLNVADGVNQQGNITWKRVRHVVQKETCIASKKQTSIVASVYF